MKTKIKAYNMSYRIKCTLLHRQIKLNLPHKFHFFTTTAEKSHKHHTQIDLLLKHVKVSLASLFASTTP